LPALSALKDTFAELSEQYANMIKIGRTHMQDAVPLTLGNELSAYEKMLSEAEKNIKRAVAPLLKLAIGGTAVGTGLNAPKNFGEKVAKKIADDTGFDFEAEDNKFYAMSSKSNFAFFHGSLKALASDLFKIATDIRFLSSGPRAGLAEILIPENEPGSSIMPGKVNPTQAEALAQVCCQVFGNDTTVAFAAASGNFQLNTYMPVIIYNTLQSIELLADAMHSFNKNLAIGIRPNIAKIAESLQKSLMLITALSPKIGYDKASEIAKAAHANGTTLKEEVLSTGLVSEQEFDEIVDVRKMV
jgi:fumarate hydratase class II